MRGSVLPPPGRPPPPSPHSQPVSSGVSPKAPPPPTQGKHSFLFLAFPVRGVCGSDGLPSLLTQRWEAALLSNRPRPWANRAWGGHTPTTGMRRIPGSTVACHWGWGR